MEGREWGGWEEERVRRKDVRRSEGGAGAKRKEICFGKTVPAKELSREERMAGRA